MNLYLVAATEDDLFGGRYREIISDTPANAAERYAALGGECGLNDGCRPCVTVRLPSGEVVTETLDLEPGEAVITGVYDSEPEPGGPELL